MRSDRPDAFVRSASGLGARARRTAGDWPRAWSVRWSQAAAVVFAFAALVAAVHSFGAPVSLLAVSLLAALVPLVIWPDTATLIVAGLLYVNAPAIAHKWYGVPQPIAAGVFVLLGLPFVHYVVFRGEQPRLDPVLKRMFWFLGVLAIAAIAAKDTQIAVNRIMGFAIEGIITYWLFTTVVRSMSMLRRLIYTIVLAGALLSSLSVYQTLTGSYDQQFGGLAMRQTKYDDKREHDEAMGRQKDFYRSDRAEGPMLENNYYAQVMLVLLPLAAFLGRTARQPSLTVGIAALGLLILAGGVLLTYSRGALLVLVGLAVAMLWLRWIRPAQFLLVGAVCVAGALIWTPGLPGRVASVATVMDLEAGSANVDADISVRGRATEMLAAVQVFMDHPVLGVGPGQYAPFYSVEYQQDPNIRFKDIQTARAAHSLYLEMAAETGVTGLTVFVSIAVWLLRQLWRERRRLAHRAHVADLATALALSIVAYHGAGLFLSFAYERYYWLLLSIAGAALQVMRSDAVDPVLASGRYQAPGTLAPRMGCRSWCSPTACVRTASASEL